MTDKIHVLVQIKHAVSMYAVDGKFHLFACQLIETSGRRLGCWVLHISLGRLKFGLLSVQQLIQEMIWHEDTTLLISFFA